MSTYTQIHIHAIFSVRNRVPLLDVVWRDQLYKYIASIIQNRKHKLLSIGGTRDHVHILFGIRPMQSVSSILMEIKRDSSEWINRKRFIVGKFEWQEGYGAFSHSKSQITQVANYIENQEKHHEKCSSADEFRKILDDLGIEYDERYMF